MNAALERPDRWLGYTLRGSSEFVPFWDSLIHSRKRDLLFVVGSGFDPRMSAAAKAIMRLGGEGVRRCLVVEYDEGSTSPSRAHDDLAASNAETLGALFNRPDQIVKRRIDMLSADGRRRVGSRRAAEVFESVNDIAEFTDILLDINALPRSIYMPMLAKLLYLIDMMAEFSNVNLHVLTSNDPVLDRAITDKGLSDDATYLHGFESGIEQESTADVPKVWMPILGEGKTPHFERIYDLVTPDEIVPAFPFPCANPRRTDDLLLEYRPYLFDRLRVEPANFMYVSEQNPFGVYREIVSAVRHYADALAPLGGCKVVISTLSSKLLSLGGLLAAYELKRIGYSVGIAHVESEGYEIGANTPETVSDNLFEVWVAGEPYVR